MFLAILRRLRLGVDGVLTVLRLSVIKRIALMLLVIHHLLLLIVFCEHIVELGLILLGAALDRGWYT